MKISQAARLCQMTIRQLTYWINLGYVQCVGGSRKRILKADSLEKICLIKQGLEQGFRLRDAVAEAESFIARRTQEKARLEALPDEDLEGLITKRLERLQRLANGIRLRLSSRSIGVSLEQSSVDEEICGKVIQFMSQNPYKIFTARQIKERLGLLDGEVQKVLDLLEERCFLLKIVYPGADVYRHLPRYRPPNQ
jgi:DNA-binding transcriptional MerR regulator